MGSRAGSHESREVTTGVGSHKLGKRQGTYRQSKRGLRRSTLRPCTLDQTHVSCLHNDSNWIFSFFDQLHASDSRFARFFDSI